MAPLWCSVSIFDFCETPVLAFAVLSEFCGSLDRSGRFLLCVFPPAGGFRTFDLRWTFLVDMVCFFFVSFGFFPTGVDCFLSVQGLQEGSVSMFFFFFCEFFFILCSFGFRPCVGFLPFFYVFHPCSSFFFPLLQSSLVFHGGSGAWTPPGLCPMNRDYFRFYAGFIYPCLMGVDLRFCLLSPPPFKGSVTDQVLPGFFPFTVAISTSSLPFLSSTIRRILGHPCLRNFSPWNSPTP